MRAALKQKIYILMRGVETDQKQNTFFVWPCNTVIVQMSVDERNETIWTPPKRMYIPLTILVHSN